MAALAKQSKAKQNVLLLLLLDQGTKYFVKVAMGGRDEGMFKGEALGLQAMYGEARRLCMPATKQM